MKDFYWDIRPKPEFGTIEIRVFDTPLTIERAAALAGYVQSLGAWFLADAALHAAAKTTTSSTPTTASRPAASGWRRCTWTRPRATTCRCAEHILMTMDTDRRPRCGAWRLAPCTCCAPTRQAGQNDARWLRERQAPGTAAGRGQPPGGAALSRRTCLMQAASTRRQSGHG